MPIAPKPFTYVCKKCGYIKYVNIKSDALTPIDIVNLSPICPKCSSKMDKKTPTILDLVKNIFN